MQTTSGTNYVKRPSDSKRRTIVVTKAVLCKNHSKQSCKQRPVLGCQTTWTKQKKNNSRYQLRLSFIRTKENNYEDTSSYLGCLTSEL